MLKVKNLNIVFPGLEGPATVSDKVSFEIKQGDSLCLVGESGSGKTMVALGIMKLLAQNAQVSGTVDFKGKDLLSMNKQEIRKIRGRDISMIFEQPGTCLNPVFPVGEQIAEAFRIHKKCSRKDSKDRTLDLMRKVGIDTPEKRYRYYPHEFSGGMAQRVMIAMALAFSPALLIADEPTTSLDVTIQAQIVELLKNMINEHRTSLLLISHDLGIASRLCKRVAVMYAGSIVEYGPLTKIFTRPGHPYTRALLDAAYGKEEHLLEGFVPEFSRLPDGCRFHPRCQWTQKVCKEQVPKMNNGVKCHLHGHFNSQACI